MVESERRARERRFEELARAVATPLRRYLVRRLDADEVDDVLAEVMLVLWRRLDDVPHDGPDDWPDGALPWCYGVARGCLANARRSHRRRLRLVQRVVAERPPSSGAEDHPEDHPEVHRGLAALGELDREVVRLWAWEGLAPREIAAVTGLTANAVSIRLHRAKVRLAAGLERKDRPGAGQEKGEGRSRR